MPAPHNTTIAALALVWLEELPDKWKLILTIGAILTAGVAIGAAGVNFRGLPARVVALERSARANDSLHRELNVRIGTLESTAAADRRRIEAKLDQLLCFAEAQRGDRSYESCIN